MARRRHSFLLLLCLSFILFVVSSGAHPNARSPHHNKIQSLELSIEKWEQDTSTPNSTVSTDSLEEDIAKLPKSLKDFLQLLSLGLRLFGDALASLVQDRIAPGTTSTSALLTDGPSLASLVPPVSTHSWSNSSIAASTYVAPINSTSFVTLTSTRLFTVTKSRSRPAALAISTDSIAPSASAVVIKSDALPFERRNIVQVYAGRYPGIARTISDLTTLCADDDIDIITLAGVTAFFSDQTTQPIPTADFDGLCDSDLSLAGEGECGEVWEVLHACQTSQKKKLFLAIETGTDDTTLRSGREATTLAQNLWDIFGAGKASASGARKYTSPPRNGLGIAFDGFEFLVNTTTVDDEYFAAVAKAKRDDSIFMPPTLPYFDVLFDELRELILTGDGSKPYYLSVSLPCTRPSILSKTALQLADFVSVRFMNDIACNINGLAFSNFLTVWGKDVADRSSADRMGIPAVEAESTTTMTTTRLRTTTLKSLAAPGPTEAFRLINPDRFSIPRYTPLPVTETLILDSWSLPEEVKRQVLLHSPPHFILGIPVPSQEIQNATALSGAGSADPATLSTIIEHARTMIPGFVGVLLWGGVEDMEVGREDGYLGFVKNVLDRVAPGGMVPAPSPSPARILAPILSALPQTRTAGETFLTSGEAAVFVSEPMLHILPVSMEGDL